MAATLPPRGSAVDAVQQLCSSFPTSRVSEAHGRAMMRGPTVDAKEVPAAGVDFEDFHSCIGSVHVSLVTSQVPCSVPASLTKSHFQGLVPASTDMLPISGSVPASPCTSPQQASYPQRRTTWSTSRARDLYRRFCPLVELHQPC
jgi:hypothetical protein